MQEAIQSVIDQDYKNIELIVIDDGSKDNSVEKIKEMIPACKERFFRFEFRCRANKGLCATLNEALEWCKGLYVSPFASDDVALPHKTSFLVDKIINTNYAAVFGQVAIYGSGVYKNKNIRESIIHCFEDLICGLNMPSAPAALIKLSELRRAGLYKESLPIEDWYMWLKLTQNGGTLSSFPEVVARYRRHGGNITSNQEGMQKARLLLLREFEDSNIYRKAIKYSYLQSARDFALTNKALALKMFALSLPPRKNAFFVLIKIISPMFIIKFLLKNK